MELNEQERQLIEIIRANANANGFCLQIERQDGVWEVFLAVPLKTRTGQETISEGRGAGTTFGRAWDNVANVKFG
jgi:hypothetical protein